MNRNQKNVISEYDLAPYINMRFVSVGWRFFFYFFLVSLLPIVISGYFLVSKINYELKNSIQRNMESSLDLKISRLELWMEGRGKDFESIHSNEELIFLVRRMFLEKSPDARSALREKMNLLLTDNENFSGLFLADYESGKTIVSTDPVYEGSDNKSEEYFIQGKKDFFHGKIEYSTALKSHNMVMSIPIEDSSGNFLCVLVARADIDIALELLSYKPTHDKTLEIYAVDENKVRIYPSSYVQSDQFQNPDNRKYVFTYGVERALAGERRVSVYNNYEGVPVVGYSSFLPELGIVLLAEQNRDEAFLPAYSVIKTLFFILLIVFITDVILAFIITSSIAKPLNNLSDSAKRVQEGDLKAFADIKSYDEFGALADSFNKMAESLILSLSETKNIINTMPNALFILDVKGRIKSANEYASKLTEFSQKDLIGRYFDKTVRHPPSSEYESAPFDLDQLVNKEKVNDIQMNCFTNFHNIIPISLSGVALKNKDKKLIGFIVIGQDLRSIKEYAKERVQAITPLMHKMSLGDFSQKLKIPGTEDEFTELLISLNLMADNLRELISENQRKTFEIGKSKEITEKEKAKAEALLGSIGEGIIAINLSGKIIIMNPQAEHMFEKSIKEAVGKQYFDVFVFEDEKGGKIQPNSYPISEAVAKKKKIHTITYFIKKNGDRFPLSTTVSPILFENKIFGVIGTFRDITKEMEVDRAKSEFVSLASHQLRTPLAGINWLLQEISRKGNLDDMQKEYLQDALKSSQRMVRLVNDLLNVSRLETGIISVNYENVDLMDFVEEFVKEARFIAKDKNQTIEFDKGNEKIPVSLDRDLIGQVISNLISNAIVYTDKGKKITISARKNKDHIKISVSDQGIGISKDDQEKLFTKFFRTNESSKYSTTGSGLGLYIVKKILDICYGIITCSSAEGEGTTFTVKLPIKVFPGKQGNKKLIKRQLI